MDLLEVRDLLEFPDGNNASDTVINGVHFNLTTLLHFNFTLYSNGTLSNGSRCILTDGDYTPDYVWTNGSFINSTSCYNPVDPIGDRAIAGIVFAVLFAFCLVLVLMNLKKHGTLHLPGEKRFTPIGRRWQWYWSIWVIAMAVVSLFTNVDVDRFRVMGLPIILNSFFWYLMQQGVLSLVWEAARHWGSWQERQFIDPDPFVLREDDRRAKFEFWMPLVLYLFIWLNFFMIIPRNWGRIELQRTPQQIEDKAGPAATDVRFKIAALFLLFCWMIIVVSLRHSVKHYKPRNRGIINKTIGLVKYTPLRFRLLLPLALVVVGFQAFCAFTFDYSVLNAQSSLASVYVGGYVPALLILVVQIVWGFRTPNEDKELIRQRRTRGQEYDREMGYVQKPSWWRRGNNAMRHDQAGTDSGATSRGVKHARIKEMRNAERHRGLVELRDLTKGGPGGGPNPARRQSEVNLLDGSKKPGIDASYMGKSDRRRTEHARNAAADLLFPAAGGQSASEAQVARRAELMMDGPAPPPYAGQQRGRGEGDAATDATTSPGGAARSPSANTGTSSAPPQKIKSMLDV
ncbi:hypothetical protein HYQ45_014648 [Verticillium longisporum]|uniref:Uncharacterized protein n=1 Tax=Verticillium longisporum TaxID=100787 RepID=A0A8I2Z9L0_VERLO|nr:hypothetical protein HYQ45_014648 [Verticillium longisporum]